MDVEVNKNIQERENKYVEDPNNYARNSEGMGTTLWCLIERDTLPFEINVPGNASIHHLKEIIHEKRRNGVVGNVDAADLVLWKIKNPIAIKPSRSLAEHIRSLRNLVADFAEELDEPVDKVSAIFPQPPEDHLHILVQPPVSEFSSLGWVLELVSRDDLPVNLKPPRGSLGNIESIKSTNENLNTLALITTFVAAVQAQVITYANQRNSTNIQIAVNAIFFMGLFLDIAGGCMIYAVSIQLQRTYMLLLLRKDALDHLIAILNGYEDAPALSLLSTQLRYIERAIFYSLVAAESWTPQRFIPTPDKFNQLRTSSLWPRVEMYIYDLYHPNNPSLSELMSSRKTLRFAITMISALRLTIFSGVGCIIVGTLCHEVDFQPIGVQIPSFVVVGATLAIPVVIFLKQRWIRPVSIGSNAGSGRFHGQRMNNSDRKRAWLSPAAASQRFETEYRSRRPL